MLCEAIEAAVRPIKEPDILKIETMIDKIINQRIEDLIWLVGFVVCFIVC